MPSYIPSHFFSATYSFSISELFLCIFLSEEVEQIRLDPTGAVATTSPCNLTKYVSKPIVTEHSAVKSAVVAVVSADSCSGITEANFALSWLSPQLYALSGTVHKFHQISY